MSGGDARRAFTPQYQVIAPDVVLGDNVRISSFVNLYGCAVGDETTVGAFTEIQAGATIGARCKISSHTFVCTGVTIEDGCFIGHGVAFINDRYPRAVNADGAVQEDRDWELISTRVAAGASIGSGATILGDGTVALILDVAGLIRVAHAADTTVDASPSFKIPSPLSSPTGLRQTERVQPNSPSRITTRRSTGSLSCS